LEPVRCLGYILAIRELVAVSFQDRTALRGVQLPSGARAGILAAGLTMILAAPTSHMFHGRILMIVRVERGISFGLAIFAMSILYTASRKSVQLSRNSLVLFLFWIVWFLGDSTLLMASSLLPASRSVLVNDALALFEVCSYAGWALLLSKAREHESLRLTTVRAFSDGLA